MKGKYVLFILCLFYLSGNIFSQTRETGSEQDRTIDSLKTLLRSNIPDTVKLKIYSDLNWIFAGTDSKISKDYGFLELALAEKIKDKKWIAQSYNDIGISNYKLGLLDSALYYYKKSLQIRKTCNDKNLIASSTAKIGVIYQEQGDFNKALECNLSALKIYEELGKDNYQAMMLNNISVVYDKLKKYDKVIEYGERAIAIHLKNKNEYELAFCYANIASAYKAKKDIKKSDEYLQNALSIYRKFEDKINEAAVLNSMGLNLRLEKRDKEALVYYLKAFEISKQINDKLSIGLYAHNLSGLYSDMGDYPAAEKFSLISLENTENTNKYQMALIYRQLANLNAFMNNGKKTKYYIDRFADLKDSIYGTEFSNQIAEMEAKYQTEKKQLQIDKLGKEKELQASEMRKQRLVIVFVVCGLLLVLVFTVILFRLFVEKKKANKLLAEQKLEIEEKNVALNQQNEEISAQRDEIKGQRDFIEEQKQEITDSINYAKRIQQAVMPNLDFGSWNLDFETFILFKPKDVVSGDFYWANKINEWLIVTVADCTGHGVPGAFMSMLGMSFLNEIVRKKEITKASEVLDHLRESVIEALHQQGTTGEQKDGMDIALCAINTETLEMQFAAANNPCYAIARSEATKQSEIDVTIDCFADARIDGFSLIELKPDKQPIGIHTNMLPFTNQIIQLQKGETIYLMSDGFEDQFGGPNRKKFLAKNLKNLLLANCQLPMADQKHILETTITEWIGTSEQIDDITILGIKI